MLTQETGDPLPTSSFPPVRALLAAKSVELAVAVLSMYVLALNGANCTNQAQNSPLSHVEINLLPL